MKSSPILSVVLLVVLSLAFPASAHVPLMAGGNENISSAMHITDPGKSWAVYGSLEKDVVHYYSFDLEEGERIYLSLFKSSDAKEKDFLPALVLLGPGLEYGRDAAGQLALPREASNLKILTAEGKNAANAVYEPFGPSSFIELAEINISAPESARYYAAVYSNANSISNSTNGTNSTLGHYGLAVGYREEFSFSERITTPLRLISVYLWEGQSLGLILIPYLVAEIISSPVLLAWLSSHLILPGWIFRRISLPGHQRLRLHADGLQSHSRFIWAGGVHHSGYCSFSMLSWVWQPFVWPEERRGYCKESFWPSWEPSPCWRARG